MTDDAHQRILHEWLLKSEADYDIAELLWTSEKGTVYEGICFHCQQCIEKLLKAYLIKLSHRPPKTHSLPQLNQLITTLKPDWQMDIYELEFLTKYAIEARYPGATAFRSEAEEALQICIKLREYIREYFKTS